MTMDKLLDVLTTQGLAVMLVIVGLIGIFWACRWSSTNLLVPLKDRAIAHLDKVGSSMDKLNDTLRDMRNEITDGFSEVNSKIDQTESKVDELLCDGGHYTRRPTEPGKLQVPR